MSRELSESYSDKDSELLQSMLMVMQNIAKNVEVISHYTVRSKEKTHLSPEYESLYSHSSLPISKSTKTYQLEDTLTPLIDLLNIIENDNDLASVVSLDETSEKQIFIDDSRTQKLIALIANLAQWDKITRIWEIVADRCKQQQRPATSDELHVLSAAIDIHNLTWRDKAAQLCPIDCPVSFNYKVHQRGNATGDTVVSEWLPALTNPGKTTTLNAIVFTK